MSVAIDAVRRVCAAGSMQRPSARLSVCPSVRLSHRSTVATAAGRFAAELPTSRRTEISIDSCGRRAAGDGAQRQMRAASR